MRQTFVAALAIAAVAGLCLAHPALADQKETETVDKVVPIAQGGLLRLKTFSGRVTIVAADRNDVSIKALRRATRDRLDHIKLDIQADGKDVIVHANKRDASWDERNNNVVETEFDIEVPRKVRLDIHSFSSPVSVTGVLGGLELQTFSGRLRLADNTGPIEAKTFSGDITIGAAASGDAPEISAETFSGDIDMTVSPTAKADVDFHTFSGDIDADLPLTLKSKSRRNLRASLNAPEGAGNRLRFRTFSGDVRILK